MTLCDNRRENVHKNSQIRFSKSLSLIARSIGTLEIRNVYILPYGFIVRARRREKTLVSSPPIKIFFPVIRHIARQTVKQTRCTNNNNSRVNQYNFR